MKSVDSTTNHQAMNDNLPPVKSVEITGGCWCGAVRFSLDSLEVGVMCHCLQCQKAQGVGFACNFPVLRRSFKLLTDANALTEYRSSTEKIRTFCRNCGCPIYSQKDHSKFLRIRIGSLDKLDDFQVKAHIFAKQAPAWAPILDLLPQYPTYEPERR